jgi:hypothetical protein
MKYMNRLSMGAGSLLATVALFVAGATGIAYAADHLDPPARVMLGDSADIGDLYAWAADGSLNVVVTFGGPLAPAEGQAGAYDPDVLYGIHIDNDADNTSDIDIFARFAQNDLGNWGVQIVGLPGSTGTIVGAVEENLADGTAQAFTGLRDDPFFFDLAGFNETLMTGTLAFDPTRDFFAGQNITALVLQMPLDAASGLGGGNLSIWAVTARIGGGS